MRSLLRKRAREKALIYGVDRTNYVRPKRKRSPRKLEPQEVIERLKKRTVGDCP